MPSIYVIVATIGRAELTRRTVDLLADQTRPPDGVVVVSVQPSDVAGVELARGNVEIAFSSKGSCRQRNHGLALIADKADIVIFFDDDFLAARDYCEQVERHFTATPELVGITGELIADGIDTGGIALEDAVARVDAHVSPATPRSRARRALYGCNMAVRMSAAKDLRFDEALPLYAWLEDIDYSVQLARRGKLLSTELVTGIHMGVKTGRTSGVRLGYSQIANVVYLKRKGTMQPGLGGRLLQQNLWSNLLRSIRPEPHIDRRGRLKGNLMALCDIARGRLDPRRIERL